MTFTELLQSAKQGDSLAIAELIAMYGSLLAKESKIDGEFDEDLYQELMLTFLRCIKFFCLILKK